MKQQYLLLAGAAIFVLTLAYFSIITQTEKSLPDSENVTTPVSATSDIQSDSTKPVAPDPELVVGQGEADSDAPFEAWHTFYDAQFRISFQYPSSWTEGGIRETTAPIPGGIVRTGGFREDREVTVSNFFYFSNQDYAFWDHGGNETLDSVVNLSIKHKLKPFGANPLVENREVDGCNARLVQPTIEELPSAAVWIECPDLFPGLFFLETDKDYFERIIASIKFNR